STKSLSTTELINSFRNTSGEICMVLNAPEKTFRKIKLVRTRDELVQVCSASLRQKMPRIRARRLELNIPSVSYQILRTHEASASLLDEKPALPQNETTGSSDFFRRVIPPI